MNFVECPECAKKSGSPALCKSCRTNRATIEGLRQNRQDCSKCDKHIKVLTIGQGDMLVLSGGWEAEDFQSFSSALKEKGCKNLTIFLGDGNSVEAIDEAEMEKHGWVRRADR
jgi:hypothetical protein